MTTLTLNLPKSLDAQLTEAAKRQRASKTTVLLEALREYLARQVAESAHESSPRQETELTREYFEQYLKEHGEPAPESFAAQAKQYIGCVKGGPPDLSTNKEYLEGYGES